MKEVKKNGRQEEGGKEGSKEGSEESQESGKEEVVASLGPGFLMSPGLLFSPLGLDQDNRI